MTARKARSVSIWQAINAALPVIAIAFSLVVSLLMIWLLGADPLEAFAALVRGAFGSLNSIGVTLTRATPLMLAGLGVAFALRCGLFNIGGEGQIYIGAMAAVWVALNSPSLPYPLVLVLALVAGFAGGAFWGAIAGVLRAVRGINEIISTILLNYVAAYLVSLMVQGPMIEPPGYLPQTARIPEVAQLPILIPGIRMHAGTLLGLVAAVLLYFVLFRTPFGFRIRAVGANPSAARAAGMNVKRSIILAMVISGGLAGLAGIVEILSVQHRLSDFFSPGYGYDAIAVALLGGTNPVGVVLAAIFFGALRAGSNMMQRTTAVPAAVAGVIQGITVLFVVIAAGIPQVRRRLRQKEE